MSAAGAHTQDRRGVPVERRGAVAGRARAAGDAMRRTPRAGACSHTNFDHWAHPFWAWPYQSKRSATRSHRPPEEEKDQ